MRVFFMALSIIIGIVGLVFILRGVYHPFKYQEVLSENVSAVQVTQVYTEATHSIAIGVGIVSIAVLVAVIGILFYISTPVQEQKQPRNGWDTQALGDSAS